jgi:hypothetical protein
MSLRVLSAYRLAWHGRLLARRRADAPALYKEHCLACHGENRLGGVGPALLPENLERLRKPDADESHPRQPPGDQMPPFGDKLKAEEIQALTDLIYTKVDAGAGVGRGRDQGFAASSITGALDLPNKPSAALKGADPMNLFIVVETGDHHVSVLDGDKLERIHRFPSRYALHGGPKYSPDGRFVYFASRDGWVTKYDLWNLKVVAETRAGLNTRNAAVSGDGKWVMVANYLPHTLVVLDAKDPRSRASSR